MEYEINRLSLDSLDAETREAYAMLTEPHLRSYIRNKSEEPPTLIAIGVTLNSEPVGIAFCDLFKALGSGTLYSVFVSKKHRRNKIGTHLFQALENEFRAEGGKTLSFTYRKEPRFGPAYESILLKQGWITPTPCFEQFLYYGPNFHPKWIAKRPKISKTYKIFRWKFLKKNEREQIKHEWEQGRFPLFLNPFGEEERIEYLNSLGVRHKKEVVGWTITHRISLDVIRYTTVYVRPELQFTKLPIRLMYDTVDFHRPKEATIPWVVVLFNLQAIEPAWRRFVRRRFIPYAQAILKTYQTWKSF